MMALSALKLKAWPYPGRIALREGGSECHVLDGWAYIGTARSQDELDELRTVRAHPDFDVDVYRILVRHLAQHPDAPWVDLRAETARAAVH
jgi:DNA polymerase-3 subunit epsilon